MNITIDLTDLSITQRFLLRNVIVDLLNREARHIGEDLKSWNDKTGESYAEMVKWQQAAKAQADAVMTQFKELKA